MTRKIINDFIKRGDTDGIILAYQLESLKNDLNIQDIVRNLNERQVDTAKELILKGYKFGFTLDHFKQFVDLINEYYPEV